MLLSFRKTIGIWFALLIGHTSMAQVERVGEVANFTPLETAPQVTATYTGAQVLEMFKVKFGYGFATMNANWISEPSVCGDDGYYFLNVIGRGEYEGQPMAVSLTVQTLTKENLFRLHSEIEANYKTKGLPNCLLEDMYSGRHTVLSFPFPIVKFQPVGQAVCPKFLIPITSCALKSKIYD